MRPAKMPAPSEPAPGMWRRSRDRESGREIALHLVEHRVQVRQQRRRPFVSRRVRGDPGVSVRLHQRLIEQRTFVDVEDAGAAARSSPRAQQQLESPQNHRDALCQGVCFCTWLSRLWRYQVQWIQSMRRGRCQAHDRAAHRVRHGAVLVLRVNHQELRTGYQVAQRQQLGEVRLARAGRRNDSEVVVEKTAVEWVDDDRRLALRRDAVQHSALHDQG